MKHRGEVCLLPLSGRCSEHLFPSVRFRVEGTPVAINHAGHAEVQPPAGEGEQSRKARTARRRYAQAEIELAFRCGNSQAGMHAGVTRVAET
ncbi:hypothetical protein ELX64_27355 (plasmid) [Escherichia coli]|nr:hypothetical protein ELX64_27355 [Escherichia coli]